MSVQNRSNLTDVVKAVSGIVAAYGPTHPRAQKVILAHCQKGGAPVMQELLGEALMDLAIAAKAVPSPVGIKTKELLAQVRDACVVICRDYLADGGVLVARGYIRLEDLHATLMTHWHARFMKPLREHPSMIDGLPQKEVVARLSVSARVARSVVLARCEKKLIDGRSCYILEEKHIEPFCMDMAKATYEGFHRPERAIHKMIHKKEPV